MIRPYFKWFDFWVGIFLDTKKWIVYIQPIPMFGLKINIFMDKQKDGEQ